MLCVHKATTENNKGITFATLLNLLPNCTPEPKYEKKEKEKKRVNFVDIIFKQEHGNLFILLIVFF